MSDTMVADQGHCIAAELQPDVPRAAESADSYYENEMEREADLLYSVYLRGTEGNASPVIDFAREVNTFCREVLLSIESVQPAESAAYGTYGTGTPAHGKRIRAFTDDGFSPPAGTLLGADDWQRLHTIACKRLERFGYLMTQRDKKYLSRQSGLEVTAYIWSTLVRRMGLRRIKNPYTSSNLVIYVKSGRQK